jgi:signal transduction histidine kinase
MTQAEALMSRSLMPAELKRLKDTLPDETDAVEGVSDTPFFRQLVSTERELLADLMTEQRYEAGEIVVHEGDQGDAMFIIWSGRAAVIKGDLQMFTLLGHRRAGEIIGEMALLEDRPRSASIVALEPMRLLSIKRDDFQRLLDTYPAVGRSLLDILSARLRAADEARNRRSIDERQLLKRVSDLQSQNEQLLRSQQLRQETSDLIVHDLRNPLGNLYTAIKMLELVLPEEILDENRQLFDIATANCERMQRLVDDLLDVAQMEEGESNLEVAETDLKALLESVIKRAWIILQRDQITLHVNAAADMPPLPLDAEKIDRVIANLFDNALKHAPIGGEIWIEARQKEAYIEISVMDNGPGVPPEDRERIFERFAQIPGNRSRVRGFGLGLVFCRLAVEAHGGRVWVEPGPQNLGSRFVVRLPIASEVEPSGPETDQLEENGAL